MTSAVPFVDGMGVLLALGRAGLSGVNVYEDTPERLLDHLPVLTISRAGGASDSPKFHSGFFVHMNVWSAATADYPNDPRGAAFALSRRVERCFWEAQRNQTVALDADDNQLGWIARWRESSGFQKFDDPDLPIGVSRYVAVYDLLIRNPRP
jgi:hypothetical protein